MTRLHRRLAPCTARHAQLQPAGLQLHQSMGICCCAMSSHELSCTQHLGSVLLSLSGLQLPSQHQRIVKYEMFMTSGSSADPAPCCCRQHQLEWPVHGWHHCCGSGGRCGRPGRAGHAGLVHSQEVLQLQVGPLVFAGAESCSGCLQQAGEHSIWGCMAAMGNACSQAGRMCMMRGRACACHWECAICC